MIKRVETRPLKIQEQGLKKIYKIKIKQQMVINKG